MVIGAAALFASPLAAAHVVASIDGGGPGEWGLITLRVPTEGEVTTTKVEVRIPDDVQIRSVLAQPVPGWKLEVAKRPADPPMSKDDGTPVNEIVRSVTWTATGPGIPPGQFDDFALDAGPLPDVDTLTLPTVQFFADGTSREWNQPASEGTDPESPVPSVAVRVSADAAPSSDGGMTPVIAWTALGFAIIAVALGVYAVDQARRSGAVES